MIIQILYLLRHCMCVPKCCKLGLDKPGDKDDKCAGEHSDVCTVSTVKSECTGNKEIGVCVAVQVGKIIPEGKVSICYSCVYRMKNVSRALDMLEKDSFGKVICNLRQNIAEFVSIDGKRGCLNLKTKNQASIRIVDADDNTVKEVDSIKTRIYFYAPEGSLEEIRREVAIQNRNKRKSEHPIAKAGKLSGEGEKTAVKANIKVNAEADVKANDDVVKPSIAKANEGAAKPGIAKANEGAAKMNNKVSDVLSNNDKSAAAPIKSTTPTKLTEKKPSKLDSITKDDIIYGSLLAFVVFLACILLLMVWRYVRQKIQQIRCWNKRGPRFYQSMLETI